MGDAIVDAPMEGGGATDNVDAVPDVTAPDGSSPDARDDATEGDSAIDAATPDVNDSDVGIPDAPNVDASDGGIADDIWAVGSGTIIHWTKATQWEFQPAPSAELNDVWGTDRSNVWAVGGGGAILHYDGVQWVQVASPTSQALNAIWAAAEPTSGSSATTRPTTGG